MHAFKIIVFSSTNSKIQNDDFNPKLFYVFFVTFSLLSLFLLQDNFTVFRDHFQIKLSKNLKKKKLSYYLSSQNLQILRDFFIQQERTRLNLNKTRIIRFLFHIYYSGCFEQLSMIFKYFIIIRKFRTQLQFRKFSNPTLVYRKRYSKQT